ncbi:OLC1v1032817C1 [Oldenlandia corymbosa var. corymbosa]|uniref:OLC1v1032817C1 n=1 Tax=Oldenlandia corymbosa var. corymbosa TaxID=529605 RepID=A0AAV1CLX9_OLDCO|nr:OLC1v1032817C1 [Oldenlandia corymbosa var. corymbosa]
MADLLRPTTLAERDIDQAITALKKGAFLLKYGRRGKPKFCPFRLSSDESVLIWYYGKEEKQLDLRQVSRIIPGQRTAIFQRYPRPEKEYQSFSLIYNDRSLDVICKDKDEAEVWFAGLKALIAQGSYRKARNEAKTETSSCESPRGRKAFPSNLSSDQGDTPRPESIPQSRLGKAFADIVSYTATSKNPLPAETVTSSIGSLLPGPTDNSNGRSSTGDTNRVSLSSAVSSSSQGSCREDFECLGDVFIWGEATGEGLLGGGELRVGELSNSKINANIPKALDSTMVLDVQSVACGDKYAILVTKHGEVFSWGEDKGGRLGHGLETDLSNPKLVGALSGMSIEMVACGEYHTCAVTLSGDLYSWGDGTHNCGLLGHGSEASYWIPKKINGFIEGIQVSYVSCGPWHTAVITSAGQLFTFGDGTFGALGHGDRAGTYTPREVESLKGLRTVRVACGVWHTAAVVEISVASNPGLSDGCLSGSLFSWGNGDDGQLGHCDKKCRLVPQHVAALDSLSFSRVACGQNLTVALTTAGKVYTMGSIVHGQLGNPLANGKDPTCVEGKIANSFVEEIACGSHHVAVLTSKMEVYTWGKGSNGQLGHGQNNDRDSPNLVNFLKDKQVRSVACGSNFTAVICLHKGMSSADNSVCSGCRNPFNFRRKRHNCYNCGLAFCTACSSRKSMRASLAPSINKPFRVCDDCYSKLQKSLNSRSAPRIPNVKSATGLYRSSTEKLPESKLLHSDSFSLADAGNIKNMSRVASSGSNLFLFQNVDDQRVSASSKSPKGPTGTSKILPLSLPSSRMGSRSPSPVQGKSRPLHAATSTLSLNGHKDESSVGDLKQENDILHVEIKCLKAQVEELASKLCILEADLESKSKQLKEATAQAADEAEKSRAAKEVIKSLTAQLKEMAERVPEPESPSTVYHNLNANVEQASEESYMPGSGRNVNRLPPVSTGSSASSNNPSLSNGAKDQLQKPERVIQDEPGVYISLCSSPGGGNELRRVRFSRKHFSEEQAEKWWAENGTKVLERHNVRLPT